MHKFVWWLDGSEKVNFYRIKSNWRKKQQPNRLVICWAVRVMVKSAVSLFLRPEAGYLNGFEVQLQFDWLDPDSRAS